MLKTFGRVVRCHDELSVLEAELMAVGKRHAMMQMKPELFGKVGDALLWLLETDVAQHRWDPEHSKAFQTVTAFVTTAMAKGTEC